MKDPLRFLIPLLTISAISFLLSLTSAGAQTSQKDIFLPLIGRNFPHRLTICLGEEPHSLYVFDGSSQSRRNVLEAIYDGPIDSNSFFYQAVILEKLPKLGDGDVTLRAKTVNQGDMVVDAFLDVVTLQPGVMVIPYGQSEPVEYTGGAIDLYQLVVTFKLKGGLTWSDGEPLTAQDSVYAYKLQADPATPAYKFNIERTAAYKALDSLTTRWTGLPGFRDPTYYLNFFGPAPQHVWGLFTAGELLEAEVSTRKPIGWGPYVIEEWVDGETIRLHKNYRYERAGEGLPEFHELTFRFVGTDGNASIDALLSGGCDLLAEDTGVSDEIDRLLALEQDGLLKTAFSTGVSWEHLDFGIQHITYDDSYDGGANDRPNFFGDVRTRRAFAMCMDRQEIVNTLFYGKSLAPNTYLSPLHPLYNDNAAHYSFDVNAAANLLNQVGWLDHDGNPATPRVASSVAGVANGTQLSIALETNDSGERQLVTQMLADSLAKCGIQAELHYYRPSEWFAPGPGGKLYGRKFDLGEFSWRNAFAPPCGLYLSNQVPGPAGESWIYIGDGQTRTFSNNGWSGANETGFVDETYDAACNQGSFALYGQADYEDGHLEAQVVFADQLPVIPLYLDIKVAASRPGLSGLQINPTAKSGLWNIETYSSQP